MIGRVPDGARLSFHFSEERPVVLPQLRRVRWAVRATLVLGVAASVAANILHALDNPISQAIAAWPPLALLLTVELISRVPVHRRSLAFARLVATAAIAGIAAWVSYWHMAGVAARYGETGASTYLLPLSVDGLIVVASICLVELGAQITTLEAGTPAEEAAVPNLIPVPPATTARRGATTTAALAEVAAKLPRSTEVAAFTPTLTRQSRVTLAATKPKPSAKSARTPAETLKAAAKIKAENPKITEAALATRLGISATRWRTIRREAAQQHHHLAA
jgi:hypothetical protein